MKTKIGINILCKTAFEQYWFNENQEASESEYKKPQVDISWKDFKRKRL